MVPRRLKLLVLLLPLFIARSVLPIGFMLSFEDGIARVVFCPSEIAVPGKSFNDGQQGLHSAHHGHEHHHGSDHGSDHWGSGTAEPSHQTCPFAFAAAAPLSVSSIFAAEPPASERIAGPPDSTLLIFASRAHPIRGPPALS